MIAEASLSFLGLGQQPPAPSWGSMLNTAKNYIENAPWMAVWPGVSIFVLVLSFNLVGRRPARRARSAARLNESARLAAGAEAPQRFEADERERLVEHVLPRVAEADVAAAAQDQLLAAQMDLGLASTVT